mgnify:CR=1 FL=1
MDVIVQNVVLTQEKIGYKIREAQLQKIPYMLIIGDKEVQANAVGVRSRKDGDIGAMSVEDFINKIEEEKIKIKNEIKNFFITHSL